MRAAAVEERRRGLEAELARASAGIAELRRARRRDRRARRGGDARRPKQAAAEADAADRTRAGGGGARAGRSRSSASDCSGAIAEADARRSPPTMPRSARRASGSKRAVRERRGLDVTVAERRLALEHLAEQLAERYGLGAEALAEVPVEQDDLDEERAAEAEALRARLLRLGDVNPAALGELEELRGRREFLVAQQNDLERSLEDLRQHDRQADPDVAPALRGDVRGGKRQARRGLPEALPERQGAARARAARKKAARPGIEIVVQPAGKKLQSLSLLSGGEKALTATALILSLFLIRPTPFCLLDEVDAPLDEANIGRFNQLVREMAETSQFVLITHNRRTMEVADTLYGITMEQAGVSKVVSVRLREAA